MPYFKDLSEYAYHDHFYRPGTKTIGWLEGGRDFDKIAPSEELLDLLWTFCTISVAQMRGIHECDLCSPPETARPERNGLRLLLGSSEIRVFSKEGDIYAAPTLIYHYVCCHHYKPPNEFLRALSEGPRPPDEDYFKQLRKLDLDWNKTSVAAARPVLGRFRRRATE